jgi:hypothetical protein
MPERRDKSEPTREAIAFHDCVCVSNPSVLIVKIPIQLVSGPGPLMNGMNGPQVMLLAII